MPRNISFALTTDQIRSREKTVTRRVGWWKDKKGNRLIDKGCILNACVKCMGLKPGEKIDRICQIRVVSVRREPLDAITLGLDGGFNEATMEGFPEMTGEQFAEMFCEHMGGEIDQEVTRIEFEYL